MKIVKTSMCVPEHKIKCNADTGEVLSGETEYVVYDANWVKVWIEPLFEVLTKLSKSQLKVASFVICAAGQKNNRIDWSTLRISKNTDVSVEIVKATLLLLIKSDIIRKIDRSTYMLNPQIVYYGNSNKKLISKYDVIESAYKRNIPYHYVWRKIWISNFLNNVHGLSGKNLKVVELLIKNIDNKNQIKITQDDIVEKTGLCVQTVSRTMKILKENGFLIKHDGYMIIDPDSISRVSHSDRLFIKDEFEKIQRYYCIEKS